MDNDDWLGLAPPGWESLVRELDARLREQWPDYTVLQVKEKFGTLRFDAQTGLNTSSVPHGEPSRKTKEWMEKENDRFYDLIREYESRSAHICEVCGQAGTLGDRYGWWATRCDECAPQGWISVTNTCQHPTIVNNTCQKCGRNRLARLEHSRELLSNVHPQDACRGEHCTIHSLSNHPLRTFPQYWREDRKIMERVCPHGVGHPDPDDYKMGLDPELFGVHGCDGCCGGPQ